MTILKKIDEFDYKYIKWISKNLVDIKLHRRIIIFSCLILMASKSFAEPFPVFDALLYKNKPNVKKLGLQPIRMIYESQIWLPDENKNLPNEKQIIKVAKTIEPQTIVCIDIEHWPTSGTSKVINEGIEKYKKVLLLFRKYAPKTTIGYYNIIPHRDYYRALKSKGTMAYYEWKKENDKLHEIAQEVDIIFPGLYTFGPNRNNWEKYAIENIQEARKYSKPVYVFLWPVYHDSSSIYKGKYMPANFWRFQLETCYKYADGIVLWGGWNENWDENAPWWIETTKFLQKIKDKNVNTRKVPTPTLNILNYK